MDIISAAQQIAAALLGTIGFCLIYGMRSSLVLPTSAGTIVCWGAYLIAAPCFDGPFPAVFIAAALGTLYAEAMARVMRVPSTLFVVPTLIVLIPGRALYLTMSAVASAEWDDAIANSSTTILWALGITVGFSAVQAAFVMISNARSRLRDRRQSRLPGDRS